MKVTTDYSGEDTSVTLEQSGVTVEVRFHETGVIQVEVQGEDPSKAMKHLLNLTAEHGVVSQFAPDLEIRYEAKYGEPMEAKETL